MTRNVNHHWRCFKPTWSQLNQKVIKFYGVFGCIHFHWHTPNSSQDSNVNSKMKTTKEEGVRICSLARNTSKVEECVGPLGWGLKRMMSKLIIHTDIHKLNNKLVNA